jgi:hypothetical protein
VREGLGDYPIHGREASTLSASVTISSEGPFECYRDERDRSRKQFIHHICRKHPRCVCVRALELTRESPVRAGIRCSVYGHAFVEAQGVEWMESQLPVCARATGPAIPVWATARKVWPITGSLRARTPWS